MQQGLAEANPVVGTGKPGQETARDRVLSPEELRASWNATGRPGDHNAIVRLLMLTGQRREEVAAMRWPEIDTGRALWSLPGERTKSTKPARLSFGATEGAAVRLGPWQPGWRIVLTEGVEDGLAVLTACPDVTPWAVLGTANVATVLLPEGAEVTLCLDGEAPGRKAARGAVAAL